MVCSDCLLVFFYNPLNVGIIVLSFLIAVACFVLIKRKAMGTGKTTALINLHIFTLIFPFIFYAFSMSCDMAFTFYFCSKTKAMLYTLLMTIGTTIFGGYLITPYLLKHSRRPRPIEVKDTLILGFVEEQTSILNIKAPEVYLLDIAKPLAYSFSGLKSFIFISIGLMEILTRQELYAVLLHELSHIKNRSSLLKFSTFYTRFVSPLSRFAPFLDELNREEIKADAFVSSTQKTDKYLISAKEKIKEFYMYSGRYFP